MHHLVLTVSDVSRAEDFYRAILQMRSYGGDDRMRCLSDGTFLLCVQLAPDGAPRVDRFDEGRIGLDHVALGVTSRAELEGVHRRLSERGIATAGIERDPDGGGEYVCFRDPDNIQVEVYAITAGEWDDALDG